MSEQENRTDAPQPEVPETEPKTASAEPGRMLSTRIPLYRQKRSSSFSKFFNCSKHDSIVAPDSFRLFFFNV